jgi:two-component system response regulator MtrA
MCATILVAEDDPNQAEILRRYLIAQGHTTRVAGNGPAALDLARAERPDLVVLDVMMPGLDGLTVCRVLRQESAALVLMLTARTEEQDLLAGLDAGADDYLRKPFSPRELTARIRALLRRADRVPSLPHSTLRVGRLVVEPQRHTVSADGEPVDCTPGEFAILAAMAARPDHVFTRSQLLEHTRGIDRESTDRAIDTHVVNLRRKIEADPRRPLSLVTVYGVGYKLCDAGR